MSPDDALRLAHQVGGLFPEATPQQVEYLIKQFAPFELAVAEEQVELFRRHSETLNIANLLRRIFEQQQKRAGGRPVGAEREAVEAERRREDERLNLMTDEELAGHKAEILRVRPELERFLRDKNPRTSPVLRGMILERVGPSAKSR
jgi:hypothetical protein